MVDAVLLEWEGVLADSGAARRESLRHALVAEGVTAHALDDEDGCAGLDTSAAARAVLARAGRDGDHTLAELIAVRAGRAFAERLAQGFTMQAGATAFVAAAEARSRLALTTRATRAETEIFLRLSGLETAFSHVVTADDVLHLPPSPELFDQAYASLARRRPTRRERTVALVDSATAIRAGRSAGIHVLAVGVPAHVALEADGSVDGLDDLTLAQAAALAGVTPTGRPA
jgi:beta-phosphoglucomutase-like phosphatase (HAD superfamily)